MIWDHEITISFIYLSFTNSISAKREQLECQDNADNEKGEKSDGAKRTDYFENSVIDKVTIYDVLSNEEVSKLSSPTWYHVI